jgi:hypothetical protein
MNYREPSKQLNNKSVLFGLSYSDVSTLGGMLALILSVNKHFIGALQVSYWGLLFTLAVGFLLIPIRIKYRRKIIRDSLRYFFGRRLLHDPKNNRINKSR